MPNDEGKNSIMEHYEKKIITIAADPQTTASNIGTKLDNIIQQAEYDFHQSRIDVTDEILEACKQRGFNNDDNNISKKNLDNVFLHHSRKPSVNPNFIRDYPNIMNPDNNTFKNRQL